MYDKYFVFNNSDVIPNTNTKIELSRKGANSLCSVYNNNDNILLFLKVKLYIRGYNLDPLEPEIFISSYINNLKLDSFVIYLDSGYICSDNLSFAYLDTECDKRNSTNRNYQNSSSDEISPAKCIITNAFNVKYNLYEFVKKNERLPIGLRAMYLDMLKAYLNCGFSHNDLHPNNILIESNEECRIIDLGRAKLDINKLDKKLFNLSIKEVEKINNKISSSFIDDYCNNRKERSIGILNDFASISYFIYNSNIYKDKYNDIFQIVEFERDNIYILVPISAELVKKKINNFKNFTNIGIYLLGLLWLSAILTKFVQIYVINNKYLPTEHFFISTDANDSKLKYFNIPIAFYSNFITSTGVIQATNKKGTELLQKLYNTLENTKTKKEFENLIEYLVKNNRIGGDSRRSYSYSRNKSSKIRIKQIENLYRNNQVKKNEKINIMRNNTIIENDKKEINEIIEEIYNDFDDDFIEKSYSKKYSKSYSRKSYSKISPR